MRVLIACNYNKEVISPFITDQVYALNKLGIKTDYFLIKGSGISGYLQNLPKLIKKINQYQPTLIHAHYGLIGLLANLQRSVPVITTFHGSDINDPKIRLFSKIADKLSKESIFVSKHLAKTLHKFNPHIIPCGVNTKLFYPINKQTARNKMKFSTRKKYILFPSSFNNHIKNYPLSKSATALIQDDNIEIIELKGHCRENVALLMNAVDVLLLTSSKEGSPQNIKEAMACNTPIVSTNVGDVSDLISGTNGCYITSFDPTDIKNKLKLALNHGLTNGRMKILHLDNQAIAKKIISVYKSVMKN